MTDLEKTFAEVEKRVQALADENRTLRGRISDLERELAEVRREARGFENLREQKLHIKERIERVLLSLETVRSKERGE